VSPVIAPVEASTRLPRSTSIVVIGGGIIGLVAALVLAERNISVVVIEKGTVAGEQSSRNLGWIRKMGREPDDLPLAIASEHLWSQMTHRLGTDVGFRKTGIMYLARSASEMGEHERWLRSVRAFPLDSRLLSAAEIDRLVPGGTGRWAGGIVTPSDGRAEPTLAASAIARAAQARGATIIGGCAARTLSTSAGRVSGVVTEKGEIRCDHVILAGGLWSRRFLGNLGVSLPTLPLIASVLRTAPMDGPTEMAVGAPDFSFRKGHDGGYTITQRGAFVVPIVLDSLLIGHRYRSMVRAQWKNMRLSIGKEMLDDLRLDRRWTGDDRSPFEYIRTIDPPTNDVLNAEALHNLARAWPVFAKATIAQAWAGMIDVTPDGLPVISPVGTIPGLTVASGFSGHGFGTSPVAGQLAADLATGSPPIVDPAPYRLARLR
jgi:glycine/D-amino acid oxidase-like deaminating enzyme